MEGRVREGVKAGMTMIEKVARDAWDGLLTKALEEE